MRKLNTQRLDMQLFDSTGWVYHKILIFICLDVSFSGWNNNYIFNFPTCSYRKDAAAAASLGTMDGFCLDTETQTNRHTQTERHSVTTKQAFVVRFASLIRLFACSFSVSLTATLRLYIIQPQANNLICQLFFPCLRTFRCFVLLLF